MEWHIWIPGALARPERYGPDWLVTATDGDGATRRYSDVRGVVTGPWTGFVMKRGTDNWFHFPVQVPTQFDRGFFGPFPLGHGGPLFLDRCYLLWSCGDEIRLREVVAHTGQAARFVAPVAGHAQAGDHRSGVDSVNTYVFDWVEGRRPTVTWGLQVAARFNCGAAGDSVAFSGCGVVLTSRPTDEE